VFVCLQGEGGSVGFDRCLTRPLTRPTPLSPPHQTAEDSAIYTPVSSYDGLRKVLDDKLAEYNDTNTVMDLVLFQQAMEHVTRIARIMDLPR